MSETSPTGTDARRPGERRWIGVLLLVFLAVIFLVPLPYQPRERRLFSLISNAAHLPILAGASAVLVYLGFARRNLTVIGLIGVAAAALVEIVQPSIGRTASWNDLLAGWLGVACTLTAVLVWRPGRPGALRLVHGAACLALMLALLIPAWNEWRAIGWRERVFPTLADFEDESDLLLWQIGGGTEDAPSSIERSAEFATSGRMSLRVRLGKGTRAGLRYAAGSMDWEPYATLRFDIFNPGTPFRLGLRIDDGAAGPAARDPYARIFELKTGLNEFRLPLSEIREGPRSRPLNLGEITRVSFFPRVGEPPRVYFLDDLRLE